MEQNEILNAATAHVDGSALLEVGTWIGRHQAFGLIANKCSAADAACLREVRDKKHYRALGLTWEEFCSRHTGIDRRTADRIVERLEEFGEAYFNLSQLIPIHPPGFRDLASSVSGNTIELDGQKIPITPDHAPQIIEAVREPSTLDVSRGKIRVKPAVVAAGVLPLPSIAVPHTSDA